MPIDPNPLAHLWRWFEIHSGTPRGGPDPYYNFWSGFGSDLGEVVIIGGLIQIVRHHNCHVKGCWRIGRKVEGTPYVACPTHHPDHSGSKRCVSEDTITSAHDDANSPSPT